MLNFLRGAHYIITTPQFQAFSEGALGSMAAYDALLPFPILPIVVIGLNYLILSKSGHPFMIHLVRKENRLMCLNIAFMSGLALVPCPTIYTYCFIGFAVSHLCIRLCRRIVSKSKSVVKKYVQMIV